MESRPDIIITGGAGFIGSGLVFALLRKNFPVTVLDNFLYGGDALIANISHPLFQWHQTELDDSQNLKSLIPRHSIVIHLAGIAGFPACQTVGKNISLKYNVETTERLYDAATAAGASRFIFPSTYTAFGTKEENSPVTEQSPPNPKTLYAETKILAENRITAGGNNDCPFTILRLADVFGLSGRTRFDALANQFVWNAISRREIIIYQKGYRRSFIHVRDVVRGIELIITSEPAKTANRIFNLGDNDMNFSKDELAEMVRAEIPGTRITRKDITFGGYRRDIQGDFTRIHTELGFKATYSLESGIQMVKSAIMTGLIHDPGADFHYNARFSVR